MFYDIDTPLCPYYKKKCSLNGKCKSIFQKNDGKYIVNEYGVKECRTRIKAEKIVLTVRDMVANPEALETLLSKLEEIESKRFNKL